MTTEKLNDLVFSNIEFKKARFSMEDLHRVEGQFFYIDNCDSNMDNNHNIQQLWFKSKCGKLYLIEEKVE